MARTSIESFEWDEVKRRANIAKHGIDFVATLGDFRDPFMRIDIDDRRDEKGCAGAPCIAGFLRAHAIGGS